MYDSYAGKMDMILNSNFLKIIVVVKEICTSLGKHPQYPPSENSIYCNRHYNSPRLVDE
jgi:hypothetical protein